MSCSTTELRRLQSRESIIYELGDFSKPLANFLLRLTLPFIAVGNVVHIVVFVPRVSADDVRVESKFAVSVHDEKFILRAALAAALFVHVLPVGSFATRKIGEPAFYLGHGAEILIVFEGRLFGLLQELLAHVVVGVICQEFLRHGLEYDDRLFGERAPRRA